jgi:ankyrin repeat protein
VKAMVNLGETPLLWWAIYKGHVQIIKELLKHGAETEAMDSSSWSPLHASCWNGHLAIAIELIGFNDGDGATTTVLGKRKSRGANTEAKDNGGDTPLHDASFHGHTVIVQALLAVGADCRVINNIGILPIHYAVMRGKSEVAKNLLQHFYATTGRLPLHELLNDLTWIGDPCGTGIIGTPPLRSAINHNVLGTEDVVEVLEYLVDRNPELVYSRNQDGSLPFHVACRRGASLAVVQFLVNRYKASVKSVTSEGDLPIFLACEMSATSLDTIFLLMKLYPDLVFR